MKRKNVTLSEMREIQLQILDVVDSFCRSRNLRYSLAAGSLLGAVRHHGYIPWDDDIDIMMPRPDYDVFAESFEGVNSNLVFQDVHTDHFHYLPWAKVYDNRTELIQYNSVGGVYIDIFPIDGLPDASLLSDYYNKLQRIKDLLWYSLKPNYKYVNKCFTSIFLLKAKVIMKHILYPSREKTINLWRDLYNTYPFDKSDFAGEITSVYGMREHMPKTVFVKYVDILFEGKYYKCVEAYDRYLSILYGDYMRLPPVEKRVSHHDSVVYWK